MRVLILLFSLFIFTFSAEIKIASYNAENLFDGVTQGTEYPDFRGNNWNNVKFQKKLNETTKYLKALNADIVALQEIENEDVLKILAKNLDYKFFKFSKDKNSPFGVGILSRLEIKNSEIFRNKEIKTRDILRADFVFEGQNFSVFNTHFLSYKNSEIKRKANAKFLEKSVKNAKNALILGDFNTEYGYNSLLKDIENQNFTNLWKFVNKSSQRSHKSGRAIDHALLSAKFFDGQKIDYKIGSFGVFKGGILSSNPSDHNAIYFTISSEISKAKISQNEPKIATIGEIYGDINAKNVTLKNAIVTFKDKNGFAISQNRRGIYVFDRHNNAKIGDVVDILVKDYEIYQRNFQISEYEILKMHENLADVRPYLLNIDELSNARSGDVFGAFSGEVKDGYITLKNQKIKIFKKGEKIKNSKNAKFQTAMFWEFQGESELNVK